MHQVDDDEDGASSVGVCTRSTSARVHFLCGKLVNYQVNWRAFKIGLHMGRRRLCVMYCIVRCGGRFRLGALYWLAVQCAIRGVQAIMRLCELTSHSQSSCGCE